jgi:peptidase E
LVLVLLAQGFYYWNGTLWVKLADSIDNDTDPTNELQDLSVANDSLYISGGNVISLTDLTSIVMLADTSGFILNGDTTYYPSGVVDTDNQNFTINGDTLFIEGGNYVLLGDLIISAQLDDSTFVINGDTIRLPQDLDTDPTNELQDLSVANDSLYISGGNVISLTDLTNIIMLADTSGFILNGDTTYYPSGVTDTDNQNFTINGDTLFIEGGNYVLLGDLIISAQLDDSTFVINGDTIRLPQDLDTDPTNELQDLSVANDSLYISGGNVISLTDLTSIVMLADTSGFILNGDTTYYPSGVVDTDNQNFTINGDTLFIEGGNYVLLGDLIISAQLDDSTFVINGDTIRLPQDLDTDPTNELQDLSVANDSLYISGGNVISLTDLTNIIMLADTSGFILNGDTTYYPSGVTDTDNQNFTINGDTLFIEGGNYVLLGDLIISAQLDDSTFVINGDTIRLPQDLDTDPTNELQDLSVANDSLYISGGNVISLTDLTNIIMLADTSGFILNGDTTYYPSGVADTDNQNFTINGDTLFIEGGNYVLLGDLVISSQLDDSTFVINGDTIRLPQDLDTDPTNELQDLSVANDSLYISGGNVISLTDLTNIIMLADTSGFILNGDTTYYPSGVADTDNQNFTINGDTLFIEGGNYVLLGDLIISAQLDDSTFVINGDTIRLPQDLDTDPTNELQDLSVANDSLYISGGNVISLTDLTNIIMLADTSGFILNGDTTYYPSGVADTDNQNFTINGDTLFIEGGNYVLLGDLVISAQLDDSTFVINGDTIRLPQDNDTDPTNELQDLSVANDSLYISGGNVISLTDLTNIMLLA